MSGLEGIGQEGLVKRKTRGDLEERAGRVWTEVRGEAGRRRLVRCSRRSGDEETRRRTKRARHRNERGLDWTGTRAWADDGSGLAELEAKGQWTGAESS